MARFLVPLLLLASILRCAHAPRSESSELTPRYEHVFYKPVEEALAATRELLAERGYGFEPTEDKNLLLTTWQQPQDSRQQWGNQSQYRYLVTGIRVGPRQSVVRIFRTWRTTISNNSEVRPSPYSYMNDPPSKLKAMENNPIEKANKDRGMLSGTRDLELEKVLTLKLESGASVESLAGNTREEPAPQPVREASFYLQRWKEDAAGTVAANGPCTRPVKGLRELLRPGLMVLVGEQLGSRESPEVVGDMVCEAASAGHAVTLGVAISQNEQERLDTYLASPGAPADQDALLRGDFWRKPQQDGRGSRAMMELVDRVRSLRASGLPVSLVAFGVDTTQGSARDMAMADALLVRRNKQKSDVFIVLAGNVHMHTVRGAAWDASYTPMAWHLRNADKSLVALDLSYAQGSRWGCDLGRDGKLLCGVMGATPGPRAAAPAGMQPYIQLFSQPTEEGFHGLLYVGALSPSMPAASLYGTEAPPPSAMPEHLINQTRQPARPNAPPIF